VHDMKACVGIRSIAPPRSSKQAIFQHHAPSLPTGWASEPFGNLVWVDLSLYWLCYCDRLTSRWCTKRSNET